MMLRNPIPGVVYPHAEHVRRHRASGLFADETMDQAFVSLAERFASRMALRDTHGAWTFAELDLQTDLVAAGLLRAGLEPRDRVMFQLVNGPQLVIFFLACLKAGLIPVCTLAAHRMAEIGYLADHAAARAHVIHGDAKRFDFAAFSRELRARVPSVVLTVMATGQSDGEAGTIDLSGLTQGLTREEARARLAQVERDACQVAVFQLSGGTSGTPKIIPRFHNEYLAQIRAVAAFHGMDETTIAFSPAPMLHNAPIVCYWGSPLWSGGCVVCCSEMSAEAMADTVARFRPNWMSIPLPLLVKMARDGLLDRDHFTGARMLSAGHSRRTAEITGAETLPLYGMTEGIISCGHRDDPADTRDTLTGRPVFAEDEFRIIDPETGAALPEGETGEFVFRGPSSIRGYYAAPDRDREALTADGFVRSGDLMSLHRIGGILFQRFEGRVKDVISRGGEKINCQEIERHLLSHPAIAAVAVVPAPDKDYGEKGCAFIVPAAGAEPPDLAELGRHLESLGVAKFKWPEYAEIVPAFPQTSSGKMSKPLLREMAARLAGAQQPAT